MEWTQEKMNETLMAINQKAKTDRAFRNLCLQNPNEAVKQISGNDVPAGFKVRFVENKNVHMTHVLPDFVRSDDELTEGELEQVAAAGDDKKTCSLCGSAIGDLYTCTGCGAVKFR